MSFMKSLLAIQLCLVFSVSQAFALAGGPDYGSASSYIGDYSGTLLGAQSAITGESNAVGLFSLGIPQIGLASGPVAIFSDGRVFQGDIRGLATPDGELIGVISASYSYTIVGSNDFFILGATVDALATGNIEANISTEASGSSVGSVNATRIEGTAEVDISGGRVDAVDGTPIVVDQVTFQVSGFQQSTSQSISAEDTIPGLDN